MQVLLCAGYPKSGNTLVAQTLDTAAKITDGNHPHQVWDFYDIKKQGIIPKGNPYLNGLAHIKTHERFKRQEINYGHSEMETAKILVVVRNPLDTLLSSLNYLRIVVKDAKCIPASVKSTVNKLLPGYKIPEEVESFVQEFNIDNLLQKELLDKCLTCFARNGTVFDQFYDMSGPWALFHESFKQTSLPLHFVRYEDISLNGRMFNNDRRLQSINRLAEFLGADEVTLLKAFDMQASQASKLKSKGSLFFPKAQSGYFVDYFSKDSIRSFIDMYFAVLQDIGYHDLYDCNFS